MTIDFIETQVQAKCHRIRCAFLSIFGRRLDCNAAEVVPKPWQIVRARRERASFGKNVEIKILAIQMRQDELTK